MRELIPEELKDNPFVLIDKEWTLITAQKENKVTKEFVDSSETFSLTFFDDSYKKTLGYLGSVSGRDEDKITKSGLTVQHINQTPYFEEWLIMMICKKLFAQKMSPESFQVAGLDEKYYLEKDYHTIYFGEIKQILTKD